MLEKYIRSARRETKCDLVLKNARYVDVFTGKIRRGDIGVAGDRIVGVGEYSGKKEIDCSSLTVVPGYIDGHVHIESSQLSPEEFASLIVPRGTTVIIADPHEITNVCGIAGCEYIAKASENVPLEVKIQLPSAHSAGKIIDGHAPAVYGYDLNAYLCGGIVTDHECVEKEEIEEKISKGMYVHVRHGSSTHNLGNAKYITAENMRRFILCTDDRHAADLKEKGHIDDALRRLVSEGLNPVWAVTCATLNCAECYGLKFRGAIAPFYLADLVAVDNLKNFNAKYVVKSGALVAENGKPLFDTSKRYLPENVLNTVHVRELKPEDFVLDIKSDKAKCMTIEPGGVVTGCEICSIKRENGDTAVKGTDLLKLAVVERHKMTGNIGRALFKGYGFKGGAIGITIAHDSHNIIVMGDDNEAMAKACNKLRETGGGMVLVNSQTGETDCLTLDIAGLMSSRDAQSLQRDSRALIEKAHAMGVKREYEAFMSLAFLSLAVIPRLKIVDKGLFDVEKFAFTPIEA